MRIGDFEIMSLTFSDLLCAEDSGALSADSLSECSLDTDSPISRSDEESIAGFIEDERNFVPGSDCFAQLRSLSLDPSARAVSVAWMLKVRAFYGFQALTAYLAVNYFDRFLCSNRLPQMDEWTLQLLSVACLSLAAKMEEPLVPSLLEFQAEGARFVFEPRKIQRMELLVLGVLDWRLRTVTPFSFISFFTCKVDPTGTFVGFLVSRSTDIILSNLQEASHLEYRPSSIAAAAVLYAASEIPNLPLATPEHAESWCDGLSKEKVTDCYRLMQQHVMMESGTRVGSSSCSTSDYSSSSASPCSSSSSTPTTCTNNTKRRKLNNCSWVDIDLHDQKRKHI